MARQARVTSIAELEAFRASLVRFIEHSRRALDDVVGEVRRTRMWLDGECTMHWEREIKRAKRALEQAEQELYSAQLSVVKTDDSFRKMAVRRARRRLAEVLERRKRVKHWKEVFDQETAPLLRRVESLYDKLARNLPAGVASLSESVRALEAYAETRRPVRGRGDGENRRETGEDGLPEGSSELAGESAEEGREEGS